MSAMLPALAALGKIASIAGTAFGAVTAYQQAQYQAGIAERNAQIARYNASAAIDRSQIEAQEQDALTLAALGEQLSAQSSSGLSTRSRSNLLTRKTARELGRKDTLNVIQGGKIEAYNYETQAQNFDAEAAAQRLAGKGELLGGFLKTTSLIGDTYGKKTARRKFGAPNTPGSVLY